MEDRICGECNLSKRFDERRCSCHLQVPYGAGGSCEPPLFPLVAVDDFCPAFKAKRQRTSLTDAMVKKMEADQ
ncbi:hypothetical protein LCGC14_1207830 [marine sediment metagenome]|uniref:Uncharacterized protein n=1 Tax=marine sediment metagenome TaxID=412755 RepID=A0A0F9LEW9_9ZZZZ|nr:hypothetical protein [Actinomycetota bacterium]